MKQYVIAVVGATGMVGRKFLQVLSERKLPVSKYYLFASERSAGTKIDFMGEEHTIIELKKENIIDKKIDIALFSAGTSVSREFAPIFAGIGCTVIDNSSCFRMDKDVPLVVPEVNPEDIAWNNGIIANPNCSTIQAMVALKPLDEKYNIKRVVYSTYQAVSGAGVAGFNDLQNGVCGEKPKKFPYPIYANVIPQIDVFLDNGYTKEEEKMINETRKILHRPDLAVTATTVRVPVFHGHSESINIEFEKPCTVDGIKETLAKSKGIIIVDDINANKYPMPIYAENTDEVYVGRIRLDNSIKYGCNIWVVADNIRKGAATNAVQIAEAIIAKEA